MHRRLATRNGPVHVFKPRGYDPRTAGVVLYVHGYFTDLDAACLQHDLRNQFARSGLNALFVSPEAPAGADSAVAWPSLPELLAVVEAGGFRLPRGRMVAIAHSGGYRTVAGWLPSEPLKTVVLLDGLYGHEEDFAAWLEVPRHRLLLVGGETTPQIERFVGAFADGVRENFIPLSAPTPRLGAARLVFMRSQFGHMELVTKRKAIPAVLRLTRLPRIAWKG